MIWIAVVIFYGSEIQSVFTQRIQTISFLFYLIIKSNYSRIRFIRHPKGPKKSDEYAGMTNKPNANIMHLNGRVIFRSYGTIL